MYGRRFNISFRPENVNNRQTFRTRPQGLRAAACVILGLLGPASFGQPPKSERASQLEAIGNRAAGTWENANYNGVVRLTTVKQPVLELLRNGSRGSWQEHKTDGQFVAEGTWAVKETGRGNLLPKDQRRIDAIVFGDNVLALLPFETPGVLLGDGLLLFKDNFDFQGLLCKPVECTPEQKQLVVGTWTHATIRTIQEVNEDGTWTQRKKAGGVDFNGRWQVLNDGSYVVNFDGGWRYRAWIAPPYLALITFDPKGTMFEDGAILKRD